MVNVLDVQDTPPRFVGTLSANMNEPVPKDEVVITIKAVDGDTSNPHAIIYMLTNGKYTTPFL